MRSDSTFFNTDNILGSKDPRYVISIDFDGVVQYLTSHGDIANVPGTPIQDSIQGISATSQTLNPDKANATIGSMTFDIVDLNSAFTDKVRTELDTNGVGLRGRTVAFYMGYVSQNDGAGILDVSSTDDNPDFDNFALFQTQVIQNVQTREGRYSVSCADIQRQTKKQVFDLALTYLTSSITDIATTIPVLNVADFDGNFHGTSYTDAPSANVIYIRLDQTKEIIRCPVSGIVGNSFTGVTRGVLGTDAVAVEVDVAKASDRRPKVEEYVYLELPAVKLAYAILTGVIEGTANVLPASWHAGVATSFVRLTDFQNIGVDLWDTTDDAAGVVVRFEGLKKQDAKSFLETELYLLIGLFSPVYSDGQLGLKRMVPSLADSPYVFTVNDENTIGSGNLTHDMESMQNNMRVDWNWNGDRFIRSTIVLDTASVARHGKAPEKRLAFRGLASTRFTEQVLRQLLTSLRDMYTGPPLRLPVSGFHLMNQIEVGDACRVTLSNIRDYTQPGASLDRTMVVHGMSVNWLQGVKLKLFGSAERADEIPPVTATQCLLNAFYAQAGTALSSIPGLMTGNVTNAGTFNLVGTADMNAAGSIFYHDAPLTIAATTTLNIQGNVQLRVRGFLTINGTIDGIGNGHPTDTNLFLLDQHYFWEASIQGGTAGFIGNSMSHHGLLFRTTEQPDFVFITAAQFAPGRYDAFPNLILSVSDLGSGAIIGIPTDLRGTGGAHGQRAGQKIGLFGRTHQKATGGPGGEGGSGLVIVCRGGDFGAGGQITLDGNPGIEPTTFYSVNGFEIYGGAGGAGSPGAMLWLIDGSAQTFPDLAGHFQAKTGIVPAQFALPSLDSQFGQNRNLTEENAPVKNMAPFVPWDRISDFDQSGVNFRISFLPCDINPEEDQDDLPPPVSGLSAVPVNNGIKLEWTNPPDETFEWIDVFESNTDQWAGATKVVETRTNVLVLPYTTAVQKWFWARTRKGALVSLRDPDSDTSTIQATPVIFSSAVFFYIKPINGTAIHDGAGTLTFEAHKVDGASDVLLSTGTIQLFDPLNNIVNVANGYVTGSDGYTGILNAGDIVGDKILTLKDGAGGAVLDTITAVDIADGAAGPAGGDGADAVSGFIEPENGLAWTRATTGGAWNPLQLTTDLDCTFVQGGVEVARIARRITLTAATGALAVTTVAHKGADLNTARVTVTLDPPAGGQQTMTIQFDYSFAGDAGSVSETAKSVQGGDDGVLHYLTNEAHVLAANPDGLGYTLTGSGGTHKLFEGTTDETANSTHEIVGGTDGGANWTKVQNGLTMTMVEATGVYSLSGAAWTTDQETFTLRAVFNGVNYDKTYTIAKAKKGSDGGCALNTLTGITLDDSGVNDPAIVGFRVDNNGAIFTRVSAAAGYVSKETWIGACANTEYECNYLHTGDALTAGSATVNAWHLPNVDRLYELNTGGAIKTAAGTLQFRRVFDDQVVGTAVISLRVERFV